jgi:hypothetical protein
MRGRSPLGSPLFWVVVAIALPEIVKKCKPMAKVVGDAFTYAGEVFHKAAEDATIDSTPAPADVTSPEPPPVAQTVSEEQKPEVSGETAEPQAEGASEAEEPAEPNAEA